MQLLLVMDGTDLTVLPGFQAILTGIARGIGRENFALYSFFFFYLFVGQISAYYLCFHLNMGLNGVWIGMTFGAGAYNILQMLNLLLSKWDTLSESIVTRIDKQSHAALIEMVEMKK
jgi:Na+-driven multidrug efflux pump